MLKLASYILTYIILTFLIMNVLKYTRAGNKLSITIALIHNAIYCFYVNVGVENVIVANCKTKENIQCYFRMD